MITSIFSKSKPINFIIVFFITLSAFVLAIFRYNSEVFTSAYVVKIMLLFCVVYFSILLLNFIVSKNGLTQKNNYEILLFSLFLLVLPQTVLHSDTILANLFILLALRRLLSLHSKIDIKKKLLDAAVLITIASYFYVWSFLFIIIVFFALFFYRIVDIKNVMIPIVGCFASVLIIQSISIISTNSFYTISIQDYLPSFDFSSYNSTQFIVGLTLILSLALWSSFYYLRSIKKKMKKLRPALILLFITSIVALCLAIISPIKNGSEFLFLFAPIAIIITNYIEMIEEKWFKEVFISIFIIVPIVLLVL
ncbi:DUF6427 family protein [Lacinutrix salivirga]